MGRKGWATTPISRTLTVSSSCTFHLVRQLTDGLPPDIGIALFIVAFLVTSYRCFTRYTKKLWGHDDSAALFSLFFFILYVIGSYNTCFCSFACQIVGLKFFRDLRIYLSRQRCALYFCPVTELSSINRWRWIPESAPQKSRIAGYYILLVGFFTPLW